jgi:hypothetical protein
MAKYIQWAKEFIRGEDADLAAKYLDENPAESPASAIIYIYTYYKVAFKSSKVLKKITNMIKKKCTSERKASEMYEKLVANIPMIILGTYELKETLLKGAPILFWKYLLVENEYVDNEKLHQLYGNLTQTQKRRYAKQALVRNGHLLKYLDMKNRTKPLCLLAVKTSGFALQHVPPRKRSDNISKAALRQSSSALQYALFEDKPRDVRKFGLTTSQMQELKPSNEKQFKFLEIAVSGGGFYENQWKDPLVVRIMELMPVKGATLKKRWIDEKQRQADAWYAYHN